ncbi:hypothetical protein DFR41_10958 [Pseudacidovorax intermedius]|uniref:Pili assembly chaperone N-terminal domain-containing protein n=2 Tax=Pseudacidovorax intermedius TaxID=433924 RepID=A0A370F946_9BURK|nr:hypothetical protein [Pseudacidovorax intermedius]RDI21262.1 hypothetical protein DFR41_10958 [Pseudacidovorax intermedius]
MNKVIQRLKGCVTRVCFVMAAALVPCAVLAAPFEVGVAPSRYELSAAAGSRVGQVLDVQNMGSSAVELSVRTLDWTYSPEGQIGYHDELLPGSCRPWVTLERRSLKLGPQERRAMRFQVEVPSGAERQECRFMVVIEGVEPAYQALVRERGMALQLPVSGRIAVAVYVAVGGAAPKLVLQDAVVREHQGRRQPVIVVRNEGDAHGRLSGALDVRATDGRQQEWTPESTPIMPGQTRQLPLSPRADEGVMPETLSLPVKASGLLDWEDGSFRVEAEFR